MKLYTLKQASQVLGKSRQWMWILVQLGRLKAEKVGNVYIVNEDDLMKCKMLMNEISGSHQPKGETHE